MPLLTKSPEALCFQVVRPSVRTDLFHWLNPRATVGTPVHDNFLCFLCNRLSDWHEIFNIGETTHVECFNDNYDIIGHVVWQPCWKKGKTLDLCISETSAFSMEKVETWHMWSTLHGEQVWFCFWWCHRWLHYDIITYVECFTRSVWKLLRIKWYKILKV